MTVHAAAALTGVHPDTAFRWRHRFLAALVAGDRVILQDQTAAGITYFHYSRKGATAGGPSWTGARVDGIGGRVLVPVVIARDRKRGAISMVGEPGCATEVPLLTDALRGRLDPEAVLCDPRGQYSAVALCATRLGHRYQRLPRLAALASEPERLLSIWDYALRIRKWLRRFRGVATKYLAHYLTWFNARDAGWPLDGWDLSLAVPPMPEP